MAAIRRDIPDPCRPAGRYGCVKCQAYHEEGDPLYADHLFWQSKHGGLQTVLPSPNLVLRRIRTEGK